MAAELLSQRAREHHIKALKAGPKTVLSTAFERQPRGRSRKAEGERKAKNLLSLALFGSS